MTKVLHISSSFPFSEVYDKLFIELGKLSVEQTVYCALKKNIDFPKIKDPDYNIIFSRILSLLDRVHFHRRIKKTFVDLNSKLDIHSFDLIHAHFLFTDGALALALYKKYRIPYIVAVRNTDLSIYFNYFKHLKKDVLEILEHAKKVVFISPGHRREIETRYAGKDFLSKFITLQNGINPFWLSNLGVAKKKPNQALKFLFVGELAANKNIVNSIKLINALRNKMDVTFTIVGKKSDGYNAIEPLIEQYDWVDYLGEVSDRNTLKEIYRDHDVFIMLSKYETFGLVYAEAMSQGLPIIYSKGQGIDGYFPEGHVGYHFPSNELNSSLFDSLINDLLLSYEAFSLNSIIASKAFDWSEIANQYKMIYQS